MTTNWSCFLFDLDGTIIDSAPGITASLAWTFERLGRPVPSPTELLAFVGPPILDSFRDLAGMTVAEAHHALDVYRPHYLQTGVFNSSVYPGVPALLKRLHQSGIPISLATSKPELPATTALDFYGLARYFTVITGASEDEVRSRKADVVAEALRRLAALGADISRPVMVGDREHDVHGAAEHGVPTIFVEWGYGAVAEQVGTIGVAATAQELGTLLLG
ncbi:HAD hydrolase-like protein [Lacisediminihabitans sp. H27-G8]|uniref:HAD hydrolase-like protein n=1 Tax=Lacisediminihabitans sp. H27-G8 TaxID=3111909 RepID=UPI0038FBEF71